MQLNSLSDLRVWIGLKNSDDQGTYFDLKAELRKNGTVIASGETKNIQGVTRNPNLAKEVAVAFGAISNNQFAAGDVLSVRILTKVADSGGHNNAVGCGFITMRLVANRDSALRLVLPLHPYK